MKRNNLFIGLLVCAIVLAGCGKTKEDIVQNSVNTETQMEAETKEEIEVETDLSDSGEEAVIPEEVQEKNIFADLKNLNFSFLSGAGGWSTELVINEDGTFSGVYHDSEMGSASEEYPDGTYYYCSFHGKFTQPVQKNEYIYSTTIENISYDNPVGTEEIKDGIRYIYSEAYGLDNPEEILIYLPGMPMEELPEGYLSWVRGNWRMDYEFAASHEELPFYGLYNVNSEQGFSSYDVIEGLKQSLESTEKIVADLENSMMTDPNLTQMEFNEMSQQMYGSWDYILNEIWSILKRNLNADDMKALTDEQLDWIAMKEQSMKEAGAEVEGGSMYGMVVNQAGAELTKERVYELMKLVDGIQK